MRDEAAAALRELNEVVERLRAPGGCPWDRQQTHESLRPYLLEETYEVLEAVDAHPDRLREELGDLLLQVLMHSAIAAESRDGGGFDIGDVAETTRAKMVHRHPHVFGDVTVGDASEVVVNWERLKAVEKKERLSILEGVPHALPALAHAQGVQKRPARVGFDETPTVLDALGRATAALESLRELALEAPAAVRQGDDWTVTEGEVRRGGEPAEDEAEPAAGHLAPAGHGAGPPPAPRALEEAVGELLFAVVAVSRRLRVNPEDALRRRSTLFADRFRALEASARADGVDLHDVDEEEWRRRWEATAS